MEKRNYGDLIISGVEEAIDHARNVRILRLPEVKQRTGLSRSTIYLRISQGTFPSHISLGGRVVGWIENEIDEWINSRISERKKI